MSWIFNNWQWIAELTWIHVKLCIPAIALAVLIAVPLGYVGFRWPRVGGPVATLTSLMYAIPALPLIIVLPMMLGTALRSPMTIVAALTIYGVALLVRSAADGFGSVDSFARESARAMGMSRWMSFWKVELPLAGPVLLSGIRVVSVSTISLATIGALVGMPSLGSLLTDGFQRGILNEVLAGIAMTVILALVIDAVLLLLGRVSMPWSRESRAKR